MAKKSPSSARRDRATGRRHPLATVALLTIGLLATGGAYALFTTSATAGTSAAADTQIEEGGKLFAANCATCHGMALQGTSQGPTLIGVGAAAVDFQVSTGRMPLAFPSSQPPEKPVAYDDQEIQALVAYVGTLCDTSSNPCPPIPDIDPSAGSLQEGSELFLANCAPCHNSAAIGGALSRGRNGPSLQQVEAQQVGEAMRTGPGDMPQLGPDVFTDEQVNSIVAYVEYLHDPESPGGASLGYTGPVAEGFVALLIGLGAMVLAIRWITREPERADG